MQEEIVVEKVKELTTDHKKFLKSLKHLYIETQKQKLEFKLINNENWNIKTNANISAILKDNGQLSVDNQLIRVLDWKSSNIETYLKTEKINDSSIRDDNTFKASFVTENSSKVEKYGASKIKEIQRQLDILESLESLDFFNEKTSKLRRGLIFEAQNEKWNDSNKEINFFHPTPTKEWKKILNNIRTDNGSLLTIITGPASVGKTTFLIELTLQAIRSRKRILVSGYNHSTINHFLQVLYDEIDQKSEFYPEPFLLRLASDSTRQKVKERAREHLLDKRLSITLDKCVKEIRLKKDPKTPLGKIQQSWREFAKDIKDNQIKTKGIEEFETWLINSANVIFTTTMSLPYQKHFKPENNEIFDLVILDDANLLNIPKALIPMELGKQWVLAGDIEQFIPKVEISIRKAIESGQGSLIASNNQTILHSKIERLLRSDINDFLYIKPEMMDRFKTSQTNDMIPGSKRLTKKSEESILISLPSEGLFVTKASFELYTNHRINKQLADIIFPALYGKEIETSKTVINRDMEQIIYQNKRFELKPPISIIDTSKLGVSREESIQNSWRNIEEAQLITDLVLSLKNLFLVDNPKNLQDILILTHYPLQEIELVSKFNSNPVFERTDDENIFYFNGRKIRINTIGSSSNNEGDMVILSLTRDFKNSLGFFNDFGATTVGFTRVKSFMIIVGNYEKAVNLESRSTLNFDRKVRIKNLLTNIDTLAKEQGKYQIYRSRGNN